MLERECVGFNFVFADDKNVAGFDFVGGFEGFFQAEGFVAQFDDEIFVTAAKFAGQARGFAIHACAERRDVDVGLAKN